jgi:CubicO group peptidase (beta-lactamase class C family)
VRRIAVVLVCLTSACISVLPFARNVPPLERQISPTADESLLRACREFYRARGRPAPEQITPPRIDAAREHLRRAEAFGFSGGLGIVQDGRVVVAEGFGSADRGRNVEMSSTTVFDIGSVTKQFTAAAILQLEAMGKLRSTDSISRFLPGVPPDKQGITIHHLLTSTAGFPHDVGDRLAKLSRDDAVRHILSATLLFPPGERHSYSNAGFALAAAIVEIASGETYEGFLLRHLWEPTDLQRTGAVLSGLAALPKAEAYTFDGVVKGAHRPERWLVDGVDWLARGSGFTWSTIDDLARWAEALRTGSVLPDAQRLKLFWPHVSEGLSEPSYYAYGWSLIPAADGSCLISHDGSAGLHFTVLGFAPERRTAYVVFTSQMDGPWGEGVANQVPAILFGSDTSSLPAVASNVRVPFSELTGRYALTTGETLTVARQGDRLLVPMHGAVAQRVFSLLPATREPNPSSMMRDQSIAAAMTDIGQGNLDSLMSRLRLPATTSPQRERRWWEGARAEWERSRGPMVGFSTLKQVDASGVPRSLVLVRFERGERLFLFTHYDDGTLYVDVTIPMLETFLAPVAEREFITHHPRTKHSVRVRFEAAGPDHYMIVQNGHETFRARRLP